MVQITKIITASVYVYLFIYLWILHYFWVICNTENSSQALCTVGYCKQVSVFVFSCILKKCAYYSQYIQYTMFCRNCTSNSNLAAHMFPWPNAQVFRVLYVLLDLTSLFYLQDIGSVRLCLVDTQDNYWTEAQSPRIVTGVSRRHWKIQTSMFLIKLHITYWQIPLPKVHFWGPKKAIMHLYFLRNDLSTNVTKGFQKSLFAV